MTPEIEITGAPKRVSIVIVAFNRVESLRECLAALGDQHQILVVDNGSRDGSADLDEEFPAVRFIRLPKNFGLTKALNIGIRAAEGACILLLHDDARITGESVSQLADFLEERQDVGAACPLLMTNGQPALQVRPLPGPQAPDPPLRIAPAAEEVAVECVSGAAIMFRSFFLRALRQIDERYGNYGSIAELCAQVRRASRKVVILSAITAEHKALESPMKKGALDGDRAAGTAVYLGKHHGMAASISYRIRIGLGALISMRFKVVSGALGGVKIDGTN